MRRLLIVLLAAALMVVPAGVAFADPPDSDPTCREGPGTDRSGECPGDHGAPGCEGIETAREFTPEEASPALDLVESILGVGAEGDCGGG